MSIPHTKTMTSSSSLTSLFSIGYNLNITPISQEHPFEIEDLFLRLNKALVILVGLPASGKSTICNQLADHLEKHHLKTGVYNAGNIRRFMHKDFSGADFFNPNNEAAKKERENFATMAMEALLADLNDNRVNVGFLDATNTTQSRRRKMMNLIEKSEINISNVIILDVECTDEKLFNFNINGKAFNADYKDKDYSQSIQDFKQRTAHYFKIYEPITQEELDSYKLSLYAKISNGRKASLQGSKDGICKVIGDFVEDYYDTHGKRYFEAVNAYYDLMTGTI